MDTGKVSDALCLSQYCSRSDKKATTEHSENCSQDCEVSSGCMKVTAEKQVYERSHNKDVLYVNFLRDCHSNAFQGVVQSNLYGDV